MTVLNLTITGLILLCHQFIKKKRKPTTLPPENQFENDETMTAHGSPRKNWWFPVIILSSIHHFYLSRQYLACLWILELLLQKHFSYSEIASFGFLPKNIPISVHHKPQIAIRVGLIGKVPVLFKDFPNLG